MNIQLDTVKKTIIVLEITPIQSLIDELKELLGDKLSEYSIDNTLQFYPTISYVDPYKHPWEITYSGTTEYADHLKKMDTNIPIRYSFIAKNSDYEGS